MGQPISSIEEIIDGLKIPVFPIEDSLSAAIHRINLALPEVTRGRIVPLIGMYHNTLLQHIKQHLTQEESK